MQVSNCPWQQKPCASVVTYFAFCQLSEHFVGKNEGNVRLGFCSTFVDSSSLLHVNSPNSCLVLRIGDFQLEDTVGLQKQKMFLATLEMHWFVLDEPF